MKRLPGKALSSTIIFLIAAVLMAFALAPAGALAADGYVWSWQNPLPQGNDLFSISAADTAHVWAVGAGGTILFNNGDYWVRQTVGTTGTLNDVLAVDPTHVWAVGAGGTILFYNGTSWTAQAGGTINSLNGLAAVDATHVWAVGSGGTVLFFNGSSWTAQVTGTTNALISASAVDATHAWAVGSGGTVIFYNGTTWTGQAGGVSDGWINGVSAVDATHAWAVGYRQVSHTLSYFILFFNGSSWVTQATGEDCWLTDVSAVDASNAWAVGSDGKALFFKGTTWAEQMTGSSETLHSVLALNATHVWAAGNAGEILSYDGAWNRQTAGESFDILGMSAFDQNQAWAVGASGDILHYNGSAWTAQPSGASGPYFDVFALDSEHVWAVGEGGKVAFWNGAAWALQSSGTSSTLFAVTAADENHVWAVGASGTVRFSNGSAWSGQTSGTTQWLNGVSAADSKHVWAVGSGKTLLYYNGASWKGTDTGAFNGLNSVSALDATHAWAVGPGGFIMFINGPGTWSQQASGTTADLFAVAAVSAGRVWAVGDGGVARYYDGNTWTAQNTGSVNNLGGLTAPDGGHAWVGGDDGNILLGQVVLPPTSRTWGTGSIAAAAPATDWFLAEGSTGPGFETWVLVQNPGDVTATVELDYMTSTGQVDGPTLNIPARSRSTVNVAATVPNSWDVSTKVGSNKPVIGERSMYGGDRTWGTDSIGASAPAKTWYLAEGSTGTGFETWVLVQNPNDTSANVEITYMTGSGPVSGPRVNLPARTRRTFDVADTVPGKFDVSTMVKANKPVVVERSMYGSGRTWGTDSIGAAAPSGLWYLAEGSTGPGFETWILVQNPNGLPAEVTLTYMTPAGAVAQKVDKVPANARKSFDVGRVVPGAWEVSTKVEANRPVVAERAMYGNNRVWAHDSIGASAPAKTWYLAEGSTGTGFETWILVQNPGGDPAEVRVDYLTTAGEVKGPAVMVPARSRMNFNAGETVPGTWDVSTRVESDKPVIAERAMYGSPK